MSPLVFCYFAQIKKKEIKKLYKSDLKEDLSQLAWYVCF